MRTELGGSFKLSAEDVVVVLFVAFGFIGAVGLVVFAQVPPVLTSFFLATGVAAFVYRFLGGIQGASLTIGALKLTGTLAALVGIALTVNHYLDDQLRYRALTEDDIVGEWIWDYSESGWEGRLTFTREHGHLQFSGQEQKCINHECKPIYDLTNGTARLVGRDGLELSVDVYDHFHKDHNHWISTAPFRVVPAFGGAIRRSEIDNYRWGMMIYKSSVSQAPFVLQSLER